MKTEENKEQQFAQILSQTLLLARRQGNTLTDAQIREAFAPLALDEEKLAAVTDYFRERRILIGDMVSGGRAAASGTPDSGEGPDGTTADVLRGDGIAADTDGPAAGRDDADNAPEPPGSKRYQAVMDDDAFETVFADCVAGDEGARNALIEAYLPMVEDVSRLYLEQGVLQEDLIGEGNVALVAGAALLGAYETPREAEEGLFQCITGAMEALVQRTMKEKADDEKTLNRVREMAEKIETLAKEYGRDITVTELAGETDWTLAEIREVLRLTGYELTGLQVTEDVL